MNEMDDMIPVTKDDITHTNYHGDASENQRHFVDLDYAKLLRITYP